MNDDPTQDHRSGREREPDPSNGSAAQSRAPYLLIAIAICLLAGLATGTVVYLRTLDKVSAAVQDITNGFATEEITETFILNQIESTSTDGAVLEVATADATESFSRSSAPIKYWDTELPLGTTVSDITVPATYRFHINLHDSWNLSVEDNNTCIVHAPALRPSLPVAIDTAGMEKKTRSGWARFDKNENLEKLEDSLTEKLAQRAGSYTERSDVREDARRSVALFVRNWLLHENQWGPDNFNNIFVYFPDESPPQNPDDLPQPTISIDSKIES
ncbi:MAG: hypothetical protein AAF591_11505 [Verrucomicrobiota bacterium]